MFIFIYQLLGYFYPSKFLGSATSCLYLPFFSTFSSLTPKLLISDLIWSSYLGLGHSRGSWSDLIVFPVSFFIIFSSSLVKKYSSRLTLLLLITETMSGSLFYSLTSLIRLIHRLSFYFIGAIYSSKVTGLRLFSNNRFPDP